MLQEPAYFVMTSNEGEPDFLVGAPEEDALGESRANFPQAGPQFGQPKPGRQLVSRQGSDEQIDPAFHFQLLDGIETFEAAGEGGIKGVTHLQAPEIPQGRVLRAEALGPCAALGQTSQRGNLLLREGGFGHHGRFRQQDTRAFDHKAHEIACVAQMQGSSHGFWQAERPMRMDFRGDDFRCHEFLRFMSLA